MIGLYRCFASTNVLLYVGVSRELHKRIEHHSRHKEWFTAVTLITVEWFPDRDAAEAAELQAIRTERPVYNVVGKRHQGRHRPPARMPAPGIYGT